MRLALGTAQFAAGYGLARRARGAGDLDAARLLAAAREAGVRRIDTAPAYGDAERRLGEAGLAGFRVISKVPPLEGARDVAAHVARSVERSLAHLRLPRLDGLLVHRAADLLGPAGPALAAALAAEVGAGRVRRVGVSLYEPAEVDAVLERWRPDLVQLPLSAVDGRMHASGAIARLRAAGAEVHVRSVLLQGALTLEPEELPPPLAALAEPLRVLAALADGRPGGRIGLALAFTEARGADVAVCGADGPTQMRELARAAEAPPLDEETEAALDRLAGSGAGVDGGLPVDPRRWPVGA